MDPHDLLPAGERRVAEETKRILESAGVSARWERASEEEATETESREHRLRVVLVPSDPSGPGWELSAETLGATVRSGPEAPPAVYIFYHSVMSILSRNPSSLMLPDPFFLGRASRAFGRVVAHEIAHAVAPHEPHVGSGLMRAGLARERLIGKRELPLDVHWKRTLRTHASALCSGP